MFKHILGIFTILTLAFTTGAFASSKTIKIKDVLEREVEVLQPCQILLFTDRS